MSMALTNLIKEWQIAKDSLEHFKGEEMRLRLEVISQVSQRQDTYSEGVETVDLQPLVLKIGHSVEYALKGEEKEIRNLQHRIGRLIGTVLGERLITWKPRLVLAEYRKLPPRGGVLIERVIERKPKTKSLELV